MSPFDPRGDEAPDPLLIREANLVDVAELGFPVPPDGYPLVWEPGDRARLREVGEIEARAAVLNAVVAATFGAPPEMTAGWLERNGLRAAVTEPEWLFLAEGKGPADLYGLHIEALWALAWLLGVAEELDPSQYCGDGLAMWLPDLAAGEPFLDWQARSMPEPRPAEEAAHLLDLHYCLDWGHVQALMKGQPHPGTTQPYVVGQRRWALEWAVVFTGPYHDPPPAWDEIDLAS
jgi:hypothetical protein